MGSIDDLVMNAGGMGGSAPLAPTRDGVTAVFASNVLGHAVLLDELTTARKLSRTAIFVGSEAARGVPKLGMRRPVLSAHSIDEFTSLCDGTYFDDRKPDAGLAYGQAKLIGAMWMASVARRYPTLRLLTVSPGNTSGTGVTRDLPFPVRTPMRYVLMPLVLPLLGLVHGVDAGARRIADALLDATFESGAFYASAADRLTGPLVDQRIAHGELANETYQDNAAAAVHRIVESTTLRSQPT